MTTYRAQELAQAGKMLTLYALYVDYTGDTAMMLGHFDKAKAQAEWLVYRYVDDIDDSSTWFFCKLEDTD